MQQSINKLAGLVAASALLVGAGSGVSAAGNQAPSGNPSPEYPGMMGGPGMTGMAPAAIGGTVADTTARLADIKTQLGISPAQEVAWKAYEQAVIGQSALMNAHRQIMMNGPMPPAPDQRVAMHQQGIQTAQQTTKATQDLYQVLTPDQKTKADDLLLVHPGFVMAR